MKLAPILIFVYNRLEHTKQLIESLLNNSLASQSTLFIYSDNAKSESETENVKAVRKYIHSIKGFAEINIIEREKNWGLANNIIDGVTTQVNKYGRVIVLEDDLIVAPYFLKFMNDALECYKDDAQVGHIQACDFTKDKSLPETFLIKFTGSWGWATWNRAWKLFNPNGKELLKELQNRRLTNEFDFNGKYKFTRMLKRQTEGKNNSWAIRWNASLFINDVLSLNVGRSLVKNNGFDGSGTNCGSGNLHTSDLWMDELPVIKIEPIKESNIGRQALRNYYARTNSFWAKAKRRISRTIKGDFGA